MDQKQKITDTITGSDENLLLLLVRQMETPVSSMKVAVHRRLS